MKKLATLSRMLVVALVLLGTIAVRAQSTMQAQPQHSHPPQETKKEAKAYVCPMHPDVKSSKPGHCPKCKMTLRLSETETGVAVDNEKKCCDAEKAKCCDAEKAKCCDGEKAKCCEAEKDKCCNTEKQKCCEAEKAAADTGSKRAMAIPDVDVLDQNGNALHFYSDLIKGKTVAINFIFTNCTTICPPLAATFARVQKEMGEKVGKDVHFISISVDPLTDTPERLKAWGAKFKAGDGWTFVTGEKQQIDLLLNALGAAVSKREDHTPALIIGNDSKGVWTRTYGLARTNQIVGLITDVMAGRVEESPTSGEGKP